MRAWSRHHHPGIKCCLRLAYEEQAIPTLGLARPPVRPCPHTHTHTHTHIHTLLVSPQGSATFERTWNETDIGYWGTDITTFLTLLKAGESMLRCGAV